MPSHGRVTKDERQPGSDLPPPRAQRWLGREAVRWQLSERSCNCPLHSGSLPSPDCCQTLSEERNADYVTLHTEKAPNLTPHLPLSQLEKRPVVCRGTPSSAPHNMGPGQHGRARVSCRSGGGRLETRDWAPVLSLSQQTQAKQRSGGGHGPPCPGTLCQHGGTRWPLSCRVVP